MPPLSRRFFATAAILALIGMIWGIQMSASHSYVLAPAHGHLNLLGFVAMSVFGTFYALAPATAATRLARIHYWLSLATVVVLTPGIVMALSEQGETLAKLGSLLAVASMGLFAFIVLRPPLPAGAADPRPS